MSRAMAVLTGNEGMIQKLHMLEISRRYCIPDCNIAKLFGNGSIKEFYGAPEDFKKLLKWTSECQDKLDALFVEQNINLHFRLISLFLFSKRIQQGLTLLSGEATV